MKTAGSTVHYMLRPYYAAEVSYPNPAFGDTTTQKLFIEQLLQLPDEPKTRNQYVSVHMPAWIAREFAPNHLRVAVLREPVSRTVSHLRHIARALNAPSLEAIYDNPRWRERLSNYQTRIFSMRKADYEAAKRAWGGAASKGHQAGAVATGTNESVSNAQQDIGSWMQYALLTGTMDTQPLTQDDLVAAIEMVDSFDVVGVTEQLALFISRLSDITHTTIFPGSQRNKALDGLVASAPLLERIRHDNPFDLQLYAHVVASMGAWSTQK